MQRQNTTTFRASRLLDFLETISKEHNVDQRSSKSCLKGKATLESFIQDYEQKQATCIKVAGIKCLRSPARKISTVACPVAKASRPLDFKSMLRTGELRHQIIKDHHKNDLNLKSIKFNRKYNIQDILCNKGQGKIDFGSPKNDTSKKVAKQPTIQSTIDVYKPVKTRPKTNMISDLSTPTNVSR